MLLVSLLTSSLAPGIRIQRVEADSNLLFPENSQRLTKFMMDATYGAVRPFSPAWAQRSVLDATSNSDFFGRLAYYEEMRAAGQPRGAIFAAERESDGALCGFADVGVSLWLPNDRAFRLPQDRDLRRLAATGVGTDGQRKPGVELRPYLSNLVVDASMRRWAGQALALTPTPAPVLPSLRRCVAASGPRHAQGEGLGWSRRAQAPAPKPTPHHAAHQLAAHQLAPRAGREWVGA